MRWRQVYMYLRRSLVHTIQDRRQGLTLLVSFLLSVILWMFVTLTQEYESYIEVPVEIGEDNTVVASHPGKQHVRLTIRGTGLDLLIEHLKFRKDTLLIPFDNEMLEIQQIALEDHSELLDDCFSNQVKIVGMSPSRISVDFVLKDRKKVPLRLATRLNLEPLYQFANEPVLSQDSIWLVGRKRMLDTIEEWRTLPGQTDRLREAKEVILLLDTTGGIITTPKNVGVFVYPVPYTERQYRFPLHVKDLPVNTRVRFSHPEVSFWCTLPEGVADSLEAAGGLGFDSLDIPFATLINDDDGEFSPSDQFLSSLAEVIMIEPSHVRFTIIRSRNKLN